MPVAFRVHISDPSFQMLKVVVKSESDLCAFLIVQNYSVCFSVLSRFSHQIYNFLQYFLTIKFWYSSSKAYTCRKKVNKFQSVIAFTAKFQVICSICSSNLVDCNHALTHIKIFVFYLQTALLHSRMLPLNSFMQVTFTRKASLTLLAKSPLHVFVMMMNDDRACSIFAPARAFAF